MVVYAVVLPIFLLLIFGSIEVWKIMAVQQSLRMGTYKAARALSWQGRHLSWPEGAQQMAETIVKDEVARNPLAGSAVPHVSVIPPRVPDCSQIYTPGIQFSVNDLIFHVEGTLGLPSPRIPFIQPMTVTLSVRHLGVLECPEDWDRREANPPPEGFPY